MKRVVIVCLILGLTLTGCNKSIVTVKADDKPVIAGETTLPIPEVPNPVSLPLPVSQATKPATSLDATSMPGFSTNASSALAPAEVKIDNLYPGATAEFQILIHNGDGLKNKLLQITTDRDETVAAIPINVVLANSGLLDIISIESTLQGERLEAISYDASTKLLTIKGFKPLEKRIVKITYKTLSNFSYYYRYPDKTRSGFGTPPLLAETWVSSDKPELQLRPMENGVVTVSLKIPSDAKVTEKKWEFWVGVMERGAGQGAQISTEIELASRILVTMR